MTPFGDLDAAQQAEINECILAHAELTPAQISQFIADHWAVDRSPDAVYSFLRRQGLRGSVTPTELPPSITRRCRNKDCINRFVPVNDQHFYCTPECRASTNLWSIEDILLEEGSLTPGASPNEQAKRAFGQKNKLQRQVLQLTSFRDYIRHEVQTLYESHPEFVYPVVPAPVPDNGPKGERELVIVCSDWQIGKLENGIGMDVMIQQRIPRIIDATLSIMRDYRDAGYEVNRVHVAFCGDMIEGCYIYRGQNMNGLDRIKDGHLLIEQLQLTATLEANLIHQLLEHVLEVYVHSVPGNHGRTNAKSEVASPLDNFDTMVSWWAADKVGNADRVQWDVQQKWWNMFDVLGHPILQMHGDQWTGPLVNLKSLLADWILAKKFDGVWPGTVLTGHRHNFEVMKVADITVVQNGTIDGGSEWYVSAYGKSSTPSQTVLVYGETRGLESIFPVYF